jgi:hypothetical protein
MHFAQARYLMAFSTDLEAAARRHLRVGKCLYEQTGPGSQPECRAVAGYLFGIAGELAVKQIMRRIGIRPLEATDRRDDPFYAHFPDLKRMMGEATGRRAEVLRRFALKGRLFNHWDTKMRYAPTRDIQEAWVAEWKQSAEELVTRMDVE